MSAPDCFQCASLRITHDPRRPYGCAAFGFESVRLPSAEVRAGSGEDCQAFTPKPAPRPASGAGRASSDRPR